MLYQDNDVPCFADASQRRSRQVKLMRLILNSNPPKGTTEIFKNPELYLQMEVKSGLSNQFPFDFEIPVRAVNDKIRRCCIIAFIQLIFRIGVEN